MFKFTKFFKFNSKCFVSYQNLKSRIQYLEANSYFSEKTLYDDLLTCLEKEDFSSYFKKLALLKSNKFVFSNEKLNKILYLLPEKKSNLSLIESLNEYIIDNNINLNSIGYSHMINFYLNTKGFAYGYSIFLQAKLNDVKLDLSVYYSVYDHLMRARNNHSLTFGARNYILKSIKKDFDKDTIEKFLETINALHEKIIQKKRLKEFLKRTSHQAANEDNKIKNDIVGESLNKTEDLKESSKLHKEDKNELNSKISLSDYQIREEDDLYDTHLILHILKELLNLDSQWEEIKIKNFQKISSMLKFLNETNSYSDQNKLLNESTSDIVNMIIHKLSEEKKDKLSDFLIEKILNNENNNDDSN